MDITCSSSSCGRTEEERTEERIVLSSGHEVNRRRINRYYLFAQLEEQILPVVVVVAMEIRKLYNKRRDEKRGETLAVKKKENEGRFE